MRATGRAMDFGQHERRAVARPAQGHRLST